MGVEVMKRPERPDKKEPEHYCREHNLRDNDGKIIATAIVPVESVDAIIWNKCHIAHDEYIKYLENSVEELVQALMGMNNIVSTWAVKRPDIQFTIDLANDLIAKHQKKED